MSPTLKITIEIKSGMHRLDQALLDELRRRASGISRNQLKELFEQKRVRLEGVARAASWNLLPRTYHVEIEGLSEGAGAARPSTRGSFLSVVYEDAEILVLDKSSGVPSVPHSAEETETAVGSALAHFPGLAGVGRGGLETGLLHRLDTGTSGLLAFAKTNEAFTRLHEAWKSGSVRKIYRAWVEGDARSLKTPQMIELILAHHPESQKRMIVLPDDEKRKYRGKPLHTRTVVRSVLGQQTVGGKTLSDLEIEIETGVMHQIRCTLAYAGFPILGDPIYNPASAPSRRLLLHAWKLTLPMTPKKRLELTAEIPANFRPK